jgi:hypothetical protein
MEPNDRTDTEDNESNSGELSETKETTKPKKKCRWFIKRKRWQKLKRSIKKTYNHLEDKQITNLSDLTLTEAQYTVLSKGLGFCPTPKQIQKLDIHTDTLTFIHTGLTSSIN